MVSGALLVTLVVVAFSYFLWSRRRFYLCALKMKGPWGYPFLGIVLKIRKLEEFLYVLPQYAKEYKQKSVFVWFGPRPLVYTIDPVVAEMILQSPDYLNKSALYQGLEDALGNGLLTSRLPRWTKHRKLLSPSFGYKVLLGLMPTFNNFARDFCGDLDKRVGCGEVDFSEITLRLGLKFSIATIVGAHVKEESRSGIVEAFESILESVTIRTLRPWLWNMTVYSWTNAYKHFKAARDYINCFIEDFVMNRMNSQGSPKDPSTGTSSDQVSDGVTKTSQVFIDRVIKIHQDNEFTIDDVICEMNIMVIAAFETSGRALFSTLVFLAMHPQYQDRVFDEILTVFHEKEFDMTSDDFKNLVYLEMCINEGLRLTPPIPIIGRKCKKDFSISEDITIPAGTDIFIDIFNIHRDEDIWGPTAKTYNPDHFLPSNLEDKHKCSFLPFSRGKRNCVGWQYAMMFLRVMLSHILRQYKFSTTFRPEDLKFVEAVSLRYDTIPLLMVERR